ncbi:hypothetical protein ACHAXA_005930, partial [Cyclostephanos tholiformis]
DVVDDLEERGMMPSPVIEEAVATTRTTPPAADSYHAMDTMPSGLTEPEYDHPVMNEKGRGVYRSDSTPEKPTASSSPPTEQLETLPDGGSSVDMKQVDDSASSYHRHPTAGGDPSPINQELTENDKEEVRSVSIALTGECSTPLKTTQMDSDDSELENEPKEVEQRPREMSPAAKTYALDAVQTDEVSTSNIQLEEALINKSGASIGCDSEDDSQNHFEGTNGGDTVVPSGSEGWSVYDCETQMLPTAPSQAIPPAASSSVDDPSKGQNPAMKAHISGPEASVVEKDVWMPKYQNEQTYAKQPNGNDGFVIEEREVVCNDEDISPPPGIMKQTPENGSLLHISYPMDHSYGGVDSSPSPKVKTTCNDDCVDENVEKVGDVRDEATTQLSQDLLLASPSPPKSNDGCGFRNKALDDPTQMIHFALSNDDHATTVAIEEEYVNNMNVMKSTSPSRRDNSGGGKAAWMTSARRKDDKTSNYISSPRLQIPSFKPIQKSSMDSTVSNESFNGGEVDDGSEDTSLPGIDHSNDGYDSIEDTQDESEMNKRTSAFKRLSRGTLTSAHNDSNLKWTNESKPKARSTDGAVIKPKVLRYERKDSSSEAEFSDSEDDSSDDQGPQISRRFVDQPNDVDDTNAVVDHQQSQTDQRIREQLREINDILPIAREIQNNVSRNRQLSDEIAQLKKSYQASVKKLNQEKNKLLTQLKFAEDLVKQKDEIIKEKNILLDKQFVVIAQMKGALGVGLKTSTATAKETPPALKKRTPPTVTATKRKKRTGSESDSGDESDDKVLISALKNKPSSSGKTMLGTSFSSSTAKKVETGLVHSAEVCGDRDSDETPLMANRSKGTKSRNESVRRNKSSSNMSNVDIWKRLQKLGWKYVCGPEPHNKVYVPKDGATHAGTQLGIHFFDCFNDVIAAATARGDLDESLSETTVTDLKNSKADQHMEDSNHRRHGDPRCDRARGNILTLASARTIIGILSNFMRAGDHDRFVGSLFQPLWNCLKDQGGDVTNIAWRHERYRDKLSIRNWCYVPPSSKGVQEGQLGTDYYLTEEQVVLCVLKEISLLKELSSLCSDHADSFDAILPVLERAVDENLEYRDAKHGKSSTVRSRRATSTYQVSPVTPPFQPELKSDSKAKTPKKKSQLDSLSKREITHGSKKGPSAAKRQRVEKFEEDTPSPSFHSSQTQAVVPTSLLSFSRRIAGGPIGPLSGYSGEIVDHNSLNLSTARAKVFFLADYTSWRKPKYILANSLGTPLLHYQWLADLEQKFLDHGAAKPFDSELYTRHRLPLGLDLSRGFFTLQRASAARSWDPPGRIKGEGETIFHGMTIALAVDGKDQIAWKTILTACGAVVLSDIPKGDKVKIDCCLAASTELPPHVVSVPGYVSKLTQHIDNKVPLLDLAWAHQSIIQRKRLPFGDVRYMISFDRTSMSNPCVLYSIKEAGVRYEVGDLVQFSRGVKATSFGRIIGIIWENKGNSFKLEIQVLESHGGNELVDCPSSAKIVVGEKNLQGNIVLLCCKDFYKLGYHPKKSSLSNLFNCVVSESQM